MVPEICAPVQLVARKINQAGKRRSDNWTNISSSWTQPNSQRWDSWGWKCTPCESYLNRRGILEYREPQKNIGICYPYGRKLKYTIVWKYQVPTHVQVGNDPQSAIILLGVDYENIVINLGEEILGRPLRLQAMINSENVFILWS